MFLVRVPKAFHSPNPSRVAARTRVARTDEIWTACRLGSESSDVGETRPARRWLTSNMAETLEPKEEKDPSGEVCSTESVLPFFDCLRSCSTPLRFKAFSQSPYPCGCSCRHFQASPIIVVRSGFWGSHEHQRVSCAPGRFNSPDRNSRYPMTSRKEKPMLLPRL